MSELYNKVDEFVKRSFTVDGKLSSTYNHQVETVEWIKKLRADAPEYMLIAALAHDIERSGRQQDMFNLLKSTEDGFKNKTFLKNHQERGSEIIADFLRGQGVENEFVIKVKDLVSKHEVGGDIEADLLKDADSLSFFDKRAVHFVKTKIEQSSPEKVRAKIDWMYERITSDKAKEIARPKYEEALRELGL